MSLRITEVEYIVIHYDGHFGELLGYTKFINNHIANIDHTTMTGIIAICKAIKYINTANYIILP